MCSDCRAGTGKCFQCHGAGTIGVDIFPCQHRAGGKLSCGKFYHESCVKGGREERLERELHLRIRSASVRPAHVRCPYM